jgi:hypothetical protein
MTSVDQQHFAYHEAGHAVIGWLVGYRPISLGIASTGEYQRWHRFGRCTDGLLRAIADARPSCPVIEPALDVVITLAGGLAERLISSDAVSVSGGFEREEVAEILRSEMGCRTDTEQSHMLAPLAAICARQIDAHRTLIETLANALLGGHLVKAKDISRILGRRTVPVRSIVFEVVAALEHRRGTASQRPPTPLRASSQSSIS